MTLADRIIRAFRSWKHASDVKRWKARAEGRTTQIDMVISSKPVWIGVIVIGAPLLLGYYFGTPAWNQKHGNSPMPSPTQAAAQAPRVMTEDRKTVHKMLLEIGDQQAIVDAAYKAGVAAVGSVRDRGIASVVSDVQHDQMRVITTIATLDAIGEKVDRIDDAAARKYLRDGLAVLRKVNSTRGRWLGDVADAMSTKKAAPMRAVSAKYKDIMPSLSGAMFSAMGSFIQAKQAVGLPGDLSEFSAYAG